MNENDFIASLQANSKDNELRMVYADWLEEQGDARAEYLRCECQLHKLPATDKRFPVLRGRLKQLQRTLEPNWLALVNRFSEKWNIPVYGALSSRIAFHPSGDWVSHNEKAEWQLVCHTPAEVLTEPGKVYHFDFHDDLNLTDDDIQRFCTAIKGMVQLCSLTASVGVQTTDRGRMSLGELTWLLSLRLSGKSDRLLVILEKMPQLVNLELEMFPLNDRGMIHLAGLTKMRSLHLGGCEGVTDVGLHHLEVMQALEHLNLGGCDITDQTLAFLTRFPKLQTVDLALCSKLTDKGLTYLEKMTGMTYIGLPRSGNFFARNFRSLAWMVGSGLGGLSPRNRISAKG